MLQLIVIIAAKQTVRHSPVSVILTNDITDSITAV